MLLGHLPSQLLELRLKTGVGLLTLLDLRMQSLDLRRTLLVRDHDFDFFAFFEQLIVLVDLKLVDGRGL